MRRTHACVKVYNWTPVRDPSSYPPVFMGRFLACLRDDARACYFQDDDWTTTSLHTLTREFEREPTRVHVLSTAWMVRRTRTWRYYDPRVGMHAGFAWLGTGSMVSQATLRTVLCRTIRLHPHRDESLSSEVDMHVTMLANADPNVIEGEVIELKSKHAFSGDAGTPARKAGNRRNELVVGFVARLLREALEPGACPYCVGDTTAVPLTGAAVPYVPMSSRDSGLVATLMSSLPPRPSQVFSCVSRGVGSGTVPLRPFAAAATVLWGRVHRVGIATLRSDAMPFAPSPTIVYERQSSAKDFGDKQQQRDMDLMWLDDDYTTRSLKQAVDGAFANPYTAVVSTAPTCWRHLHLELVAPAVLFSVALHLCAEDGKLTLGEPTHAGDAVSIDVHVSPDGRVYDIIGPRYKSDCTATVLTAALTAAAPTRSITFRLVFDGVWSNFENQALRIVEIAPCGSAAGCDVYPSDT
jgi:hypothetical protein